MSLTVTGQYNGNGNGKYLRNRQNDARNADITVTPIDDTITLFSDS